MAAEVNLVALGQAETDESVVEMFLYQKGRHSNRTATVYRHELSRFRRVVTRPLPSVTLSDLQAYQQHLEELGLSAATQARALSAVRSLFAFARKIGYLTFNPAEVLEIPRVGVNSDGHFLSLAEARALLEALRDNPRSYLVGALALKTGLRVAELAAIRWTDFYEDVGRNIGLRVIGKGSRARSVKITPDVWTLIRTYRVWGGRPAELDAHDRSPLFLNRYGKALSAVSIWKTVKQGATLAGIRKPVSPHWLRHTHGTLAILGGATLSQVRDALGHQDIRTTQRYEHSARALVDTAADHVLLSV